jgi:hypothetical protein
LNDLLGGSASAVEGNSAFSIERLDPTSIDASKWFDFIVDVLIESLLLLSVQL